MITAHRIRCTTATYFPPDVTNAGAWRSSLRSSSVVDRCAEAGGTDTRFGVVRDAVARLRGTGGRRAGFDESTGAAATTTGGLIISTGVVATGVVATGVVATGVVATGVVATGIV